MTTDDTPIETSEREARPWRPSDGYLPAGGDPTQPALAAFDAAVAEVGVRNVLLADRLRGAFVRRLAALGSAPDGWRLVPVEPTDDMNRAAVIYANGNAVYKNVASDALKIEESIYGEVWSAMLAAAPQPPAAQQVVDHACASTELVAHKSPKLSDKPAAAPQPVVQEDRRDKIIADLRAAHDSAVAQIERLTTKIAAMSAAAPAGVVGEPGGQWDGAEEWMPLAWALCADECGEEACTELVWEGGPIHEPWGDRWLKYEDEAKRLIALVREHVPATPPARQALTDERLNSAGLDYALADSMGSDKDEWSAQDIADAFKAGARSAESYHGIGGKGETA